jgi:hypothetical protein
VTTEAPSRLPWDGEKMLIEFPTWRSMWSTTNDPIVGPSSGFPAAPQMASYRNSRFRALSFRRRMAGVVDIPVIKTPKHSESVSHLTDFLRVSEKVLLRPLGVLSIGESHLDG